MVQSLNLVCFGDKEAHLRQFFEIFDLNGDDSITQDEFKRVISAFGFGYDREKTKEIFKKVDIDHNHKISLKEFLNISTMPEVDFSFNEAFLREFGLSKADIGDR